MKIKEAKIAEAMRWYSPSYELIEVVIFESRKDGHLVRLCYVKLLQELKDEDFEEHLSDSFDECYHSVNTFHTTTTTAIATATTTTTTTTTTINATIAQY